MTSEYDDIAKDVALNEENIHKLASALLKLIPKMKQMDKRIQQLEEAGQSPNEK